ncbi:MAG: flagellar biosynthesis anti-sigma factor FlgM [Lysobacterales bacterium]
MITNPVGPNVPVTEVNDRSESRDTEKNLPAATGADQAAADKVSLTLEARAIGQISESAKTESDVNAEKVSALREAIASGNFQVDSRSIAEGLIQSESGVKGRG